mmetsp:Transcript_45546/g.90905  ORF Transcript_45546/g.90905 Transcript_45546/m.90905 type:complete len:217 (-) Transcript_45546:293-943(-)
MVLLIAFSNIMIYAVEWCLYALYFRLLFDWSGTWTGFAQMLGDLLAAAVLAISTMDCVATAAQRIKPPRVLRALISPPFGASALCACHAVLMVLLAQPTFYIALVGQVLMGTVYVFNEQLVQEMLLLYSHGSPRLYRKLVHLHYLFFTVGCALCSPVAFGLYGTAGGFSTAFYTTAGYAAAVAVVFTLYFALRVATTSAGLLGDLTVAEEELRARS